VEWEEGEEEGEAMVDSVADDGTTGTVIFETSPRSQQSRLTAGAAADTFNDQDHDEDGTSGGSITEDGEWSDGEQGAGLEGNAVTAMQNEATAAYIEWQKSKKLYEDEVNNLWAKRSELDQMKQQVQRDTMICSEQTKRMDEEKRKYPAKLAELTRRNRDLDLELEAERGDGSEAGSPCKGPNTARGTGGLGESGLAAALAGVEGPDALEVCCRCPSFCGYELQCRAPSTAARLSQQAEFGLDRLGHVPPGQMA